MLHEVTIITMVDFMSSMGFMSPPPTPKAPSWAHGFKMTHPSVVNQFMDLTDCVLCGSCPDNRSKLATTETRFFLCPECTLPQRRGVQRRGHMKGEKLGSRLGFFYTKGSGTPPIAVLNSSPHFPESQRTPPPFIVQTCV